MLVFYSILLAILLGLWAWTRRAAWSIPVIIVAILLVTTWLNFRWEVTSLLVAAVVVIALAILFARVVIGLVLGTVALLLAVVIGLGLTFPNMPPGATDGAVGPKPSASATNSPTALVCNPKFLQEKADYGPDNRVYGGFEKEYASTVANKSGAEKEKAQRDLLLKYSANNGQRLAIWAHANGLYDDPNDWKKLVAGDCLSQEGQDLYNKLDGALSAEGVKFSEGNAPQSGYNSGVVNGIYSVADHPGIASDTKAIMITRKDGTVVYILVYCGNVIFPTPPAKVPTSPEVPQPHQDQPVCTVNCGSPPVTTQVCPPEMPHGTWPVCKDGVDQAPQNQGNLPQQQMPNVLPASPRYEQPAQPDAPPTTNVAPAAPAPQPAPVGNEPPPNPNPAGPRTTAPPEQAAPAPSEAPSTCAVAPGMTTC
jgi:hypothetical protein